MKFTLEDQKRAVDMFKEGGHTMQSIATMAGASREGVRRWIAIDPEVIQYKKEARQLKEEGKSCVDIQNLLTERYFNVDYRTVAVWTRGIGETRRETDSNHHDSKNTADFKLLRGWKITPALSKHKKNITRDKILLRLFKRESLKRGLDAHLDLRKSGCFE